jgi:exopolyphosphatase / guanosine-5'-triphosphate,3'-diphosphate pyrophosphatase
MGEIREEMIAALDLGTNNCRLLVARAAAPGFRVVDAFSRTVRLGEGLSTTGLLAEAAMRRTIQALTICAGKLVNRRVTRGRYVATAACREADNCGDFLERVRSETGLSIEIISTEEEARLAVAGCAPLLDPAFPYAVVFDIGGGSTELAWIRFDGRNRPAEILGVASLPVGVVTFAERYGCDLISPDFFDSMVEEARGAMMEFAIRHDVERLIAAGLVQMLGSSGTVTTLAGINLGLVRYNRATVDGCILRFDAIFSISRRLAAMNLAARAQHPCIGWERADLVVAGCAILEAICSVWPVGKLRVADRGIREGILLSLLQEQR